MTLQLRFREVARANLATHRLGAFNGENGCAYHYLDSGGEPTGICCAIGIGDPDLELLPVNDYALAILMQDGRVVLDEPKILAFMQRLHDAIASRQSGLHRRQIPDCVRDLLAGVDIADITPHLYRHIMRRLIDLP